MNYFNQSEEMYQYSRLINRSNKFTITQISILFMEVGLFLILGVKSHMLKRIPTKVQSYLGFS
jgi:hypothetical protein